jgi:hypothetical protein
VAHLWPEQGGQSRALEIVLPPKTSPGLAEQATRQAITKWVENLGRRGMKLATDVELYGPFLCPFIERYGDDLYLAKARFTRDKPREVHEDVVLASSDLRRELKVEPKPYEALPADAFHTLRYVGEHADDIYDQLRALPKDAKLD